MRAVIAAVLATAAVLLTVSTSSADIGDELIHELMCPASASAQPLATSNTSDAVWMRAFIREKAAEGWSKQRILDTLVRQYGERILAVPPKQGFGLAAWVMPLVMLVGGVGIVSALLAGWLRDRKERDAELTALMAEELDEEDLKRYEDQLALDLERFG